MVAAHVVHALTEQAVRIEERRVLLLGPTVREVPLDDHHIGIERLDLGDRRSVHRLGVRRLSRLRAQHRPEVLFHHAADLPALGLAEVHVVHGRERREQPTLRPRQGVHRVWEVRLVIERAVDHHRVLGLGFETVEASDVMRSRRGDLVVAESAGDGHARVGDERDHNLGRADRHDLGVTHRGGHARLRRPMRPERRHSPRA